MVYYRWSSRITGSLVHVGRLREANPPDEVLLHWAEQSSSIGLHS